MPRHAQSLMALALSALLLIAPTPASNCTGGASNVSVCGARDSVGVRLYDCGAKRACAPVTCPGVLHDDSWGRAYASAMDCGRVVRAAAAGQIVELRVWPLRTLRYGDHLTVYDGDSPSAARVARLYGQQYAAVTVRSTGRSLYVLWSTERGESAQQQLDVASQARRAAEAAASAAKKGVSDAKAMGTPSEEKKAATALADADAALKLKRAAETQALATLATLASAAGWSSSWKAVAAPWPPVEGICGSGGAPPPITATRGTLHDGSPNSAYANGMRCQRVFQPPAANASAPWGYGVRFAFSVFDTYSFGDNLEVFLWNATRYEQRGPMLARYYGATGEGRSARNFFVPGAAVVRWVTDSRFNGQGFEASWSFEAKGAPPPAPAPTPPKLGALPPTSCLLSRPYVVQLSAATNQADSVVVFSLRAGPPNMTVSAGGLIRWLAGGKTETVAVKIAMDDTVHNTSALHSYVLAIKSSVLLDARCASTSARLRRLGQETDCLLAAELNPANAKCSQDCAEAVERDGLLCVGKGAPRPGSLRSFCLGAVNATPGTIVSGTLFSIQQACMARLLTTDPLHNSCANASATPKPTGDAGATQAADTIIAPSARPEDSNLFALFDMLPESWSSEAKLGFMLAVVLLVMMIGCCLACLFLAVREAKDDVVEINKMESYTMAGMVGRHWKRKVKTVVIDKPQKVTRTMSRSFSSRNMSMDWRSGGSFLSRDWGGSSNRLRLDTAGADNVLGNLLGNMDGGGMASPDHNAHAGTPPPSPGPRRNVKSMSFDDAANRTPSGALPGSLGAKVRIAAEAEGAAALSGLSVSELKAMISNKGGQFSDCIEKRDLVERAASLVSADMVY